MIKKQLLIYMGIILIYIIHIYNISFDFLIKEAS